MSVLLDRVTSQLTDAANELEELLRPSVEESRDATETEARNIGELKAQIERLDAQRSDLVDIAKRRSAADDDIAAVTDRIPQQRQAMPERPMTFGEAFVRSAEYTEHASPTSRGKSRTFEYTPHERVALTDVADPGDVIWTGASIGKDFLPRVNPQLFPVQPSLRPQLLDVIRRMPWSTGAYDLMVMGDPDGATGAEIVPEKDKKPEAKFKLKRATGTIDTIAYWREVTRQELQDAPYIAQFMDQQMRRGLTVRLNKAVADAITNAAGIQTSTASTAGTPIGNVRVAVAELEAKGYNVNAVLLDPVMAAEFDLAIAAQSYAGAQRDLPVFGLRVISVPGITEPLVGDFEESVWLLERTGILAYMTDSDVREDGSSSFKSNVLTVLQEVRASALVANEEAILKVAA